MGSRYLKAALLACALLGSAGPRVEAAPGTWSEQFDRLNGEQWVVSDGAAFWQRDGLRGGFEAGNARANGRGQLVLTLDVQDCASGSCAQGAEIQSRQRFGFGRYSVRMRAASDSADPRVAGRSRPGNISAAFSFFEDSRTEIDIEVEGHRTRQLNTAAWRGRQAKSFALVPTPQGSDLAATFHTYSWEWLPERLTFSVDGLKVWETRDHVPQDPGYLMLNLWPTQDPHWGGHAQPGKVYMLIDAVTYTPL